MEFEGFKSAWRNHALEGHALSRPVRYVRSSAIRDLQRSEELSRVIFSGLFGLLTLGVSFVVVAPGATRVAAWLLAAALFGNAIIGLVLVAQRWRMRATDTMVEFIARECSQVETQIRLERYSQLLILVLGVATLAILFLSPRPVGVREAALDTLVRMAIITAFLGFAWRRAKSHAKETHRELQRYLKDFE